MQTITQHQLLTAALAADPNTRDDIATNPALPWTAQDAIAVAGHIAQHWAGLCWDITPLVPEQLSRRIYGLRVNRPDDLTAPRLAVIHRELGTTHTWAPVVIELCGHIDCRNEALAGPGERCHEHTTDPTPRGEQPTYWAEQLAAAWASTHSPQGEQGRIAQVKRNAMIRGTLAGGLTKHRLHQFTGIARTTIDRVINPSVDDGDGDDDAA